MKRKLLLLLLAAALLAGCGAKTAQTDAPAPETAAPAQTAAPAPTEAPAPAKTPEPVPTEAPAPEETPEPTEEPEPTVEPEPTEDPEPTPEPPAVDTAALMTAAEGTYLLYSYTLDGTPFLAADSGAEAWLVLRRSGVADYYGTSDGAFHAWRGMPYTVGGDGAFTVETPSDFPAPGMTLRLAEDGSVALRLSASLASPARDCVFRRLEQTEGAFRGRALTEDELASINAALREEGIAFFTSCFSCPEEIDWTQVCYDGAGLSEEPSAAAMEEYLARGGWGELDIEAIREPRLLEYAWKHTLTNPQLAVWSLELSWFRSSDGYYIFEHGDTNAIPVEITAGYVDGDLYRLYYDRLDWEHYNFDAEVQYVATVRIRDGVWQYLSNIPADWVASRTLLTLSYYPDLESAAAVNDIVDVTVPDESAFGEPYGWCYAVFTAQEDGVRYIVEWAEDMVDEGFDVLLPGDYVASGVLDRGESAAVYTNMPWHTEMRLSASCGSHWTEFCFGQDNWMHLADGDVRTLTGHDRSGERRGCDPKTEEELSNFLTDGNWALLDETTGELLASLHFHSYRNLVVTLPELSLYAFLRFDRLDARPTQAPDVIRLEFTGADGDSPLLPDYADGAELGDYQLWMTQLDGEQVLTLTQVSEGEGVLSALCPDADVGGCFTLHRYVGTVESEAQGAGARF